MIARMTAVIDLDVRHSETRTYKMGRTTININVEVNKNASTKTSNYKV
jgi:hypothetical protein